ncbi:hypothetical protein QE152_g7325 [Popillia japonica]|uniref:Uncharacterized protein n=1 Tax=Popillia japonica TaxID=7064 RepID=A0AAW1MFB0_POPJA
MDNEPPDQDYQRDYFESLIRKYECRNTKFTQRQCDLRQRLEAIERSLPAIMCFNMMQPKNYNEPTTIELENGPVKENSAKNIQKEEKKILRRIFKKKNKFSKMFAMIGICEVAIAIYGICEVVH